MPLHPKVEKLLANLQELGLKPISETPLEDARAYMIESSKLLSPPEPVDSVEDRLIDGPGGKLRVRIYKPQGESLPILVYCHGGGWVIGSVDSHDGYCRTLANAAQAIVVSVDYRLAPEDPFPAAAEDVYAATNWAYEIRESLGGGTGPIGIAGDSAGGNLAAVCCLMARDRGGPKIGTQVLIYPILDCDLETSSYRYFADGYFLTRDAMRWFWDQYCRDPQDRKQAYVSPLRAESLADLPPALILTAEFDPLRDEAEAYAKRLQESGVAAKAIRYDGMIHGFTRRFQLLEEAHDALRETAEFIAANLTTPK